MSLQQISFNPSHPAMVEFLTNRLNVGTLRPHAGIHTNAVLPKDAWIALDETVFDVIRTELVLIADLVQRNLVHPVTDLGVTVVEWQRLKDMDAAQTDMAAETAGDESALDFSLDGAPMPITHKDFRLNIRQLLASLRSGSGLDTLGANVATRKVRDRLEAMAMVGTGSLTSGTYTIYGLTTHPQTTTDTATNFGGGDWGTEGNAYSTLVGMMASLDGKGYHTGSVGVYVARTQFNQLHERYSDGSGQSQLMAIVANLGTANGGRIEYIKPADDLADGTVVMVALRSDVIDIDITDLEGSEVATVQWDSMGDLGGSPILAHFKVLSAMVPRIKTLYDESGTLVNGVVVATGA